MFPLDVWPFSMISTHAPRVRRDRVNGPVIFSLIISTHAPRVRRDFRDLYIHHG